MSSTPSTLSSTSYHQKVAQRCARVNELLSLECHKSFSEAFNKCLKDQNQNSCSNALRSDSICGQKAIGNFDCNPSSVIDSSFGDKYSTMVKMGRKFVARRQNDPQTNDGKSGFRRRSSIGSSMTTELTNTSTMRATTMNVRHPLPNNFTADLFHTKKIQNIILFLMIFLFAKVVYGELMHGNIEIQFNHFSCSTFYIHWWHLTFHILTSSTYRRRRRHRRRHRCNKVSWQLPEWNWISKFLHHRWFEENRCST